MHSLVHTQLITLLLIHRLDRSLNLLEHDLHYLLMLGKHRRMYLVVIALMQVLDEGCPGTDCNARLIIEKFVLAESDEDLADVVVEVLADVSDLRDASNCMGV